MLTTISMSEILAAFAVGSLACPRRISLHPLPSIRQLLRVLPIDHPPVVVSFACVRTRRASAFDNIYRSFTIFDCTTRREGSRLKKLSVCRKRVARPLLTVSFLVKTMHDSICPGRPSRLLSHPVNTNHQVPLTVRCKTPKIDRYLFGHFLTVTHARK